MTYVLTLCLGMALGTCWQIRYVDYPNLQECERARDAFPQKAIGDGYAICSPQKPRSPDTQVKK